MAEAIERPAEPEPRNPAPSGEPEESWIRSLAGEWQSRWQRLQYPQARSGASLLK